MKQTANNWLTPCVCLDMVYPEYQDNRVGRLYINRSPVMVVFPMRKALCLDTQRLRSRLIGAFYWLKYSGTVDIFSARVTPGDRDRVGPRVKVNGSGQTPTGLNNVRAISGYASEQRISSVYCDGNIEDEAGKDATMMGDRAELHGISPQIRGGTLCLLGIKALGQLLKK